MSQLKSKSRFSVRHLLLVCAGILFLRYFKKVRSKLLEWKRCEELALALPAVKRPKELENKLDFYGALVRRFPDKKFSTQNIAKYYVQAQMLNIKEYLAGEGVYANWLINPKFTPFPNCMIHVIDGDLTRQLLSTKMLPFLRKGTAYRVSSQLIGRGLLSTTGEEWHRQRLVVERGFTDTLIKKQFPMVLRTADDLVARFNMLYNETPKGNETRVDLIEEMLKTTMDVLGRAAFSYEIGSLKCNDTKDAPLYHAFEQILETLHKRIYSPLKHITRKFWPSAENKQFAASLDKLNSVIGNIIKKRKQEGIFLEPRDLLDIMLQGTYDANQCKVEMSEKKIVENMRTMLFAGHDTTAAALTWSFYILAKHPSSIERILTEFKELSEIMTVENLEKCNYLNAVVLEVLRLYPSAGFTRTTLQEIQLGKYLLPKGIDILILPYFIHRNDPNVQDANKFVPERWLKKTTGNNLSLQAKLAKATLNETYLPFSLGKRNCVGRKLALLEIRVIILCILRNFNVKLPKQEHKDFQETPYLGLTLYPKGICVSITPKNSCE